MLGRVRAGDKGMTHFCPINTNSNSKIIIVTPHLLPKSTPATSALKNNSSQSTANSLSTINSYPNYLS